MLEGVEVTKITGETPTGRSRGLPTIPRGSKRGSSLRRSAAWRFDGHRFIGEAIQRGAEAVLLEDDPGLPNGNMIRVPDSRQALARVSANFYGNPSSQVNLIGVTGTNGKTTTTYLLESIFEKAGYRVGVLGTINYRLREKGHPGREYDS